MSDCDEIKFYAPTDTFGGEKPLPSCLPGQKRIAPELREPEETFEEVPEPQVPGPIVVWNDPVIVTCAEGSYGEVSVVVAGTYEENVLIPVVVEADVIITLLTLVILTLANDPSIYPNTPPA